MPTRVRTTHFDAYPNGTGVTLSWLCLDSDRDHEKEGFEMDLSIAEVEAHIARMQDAVRRAKG